MPVKPEVSTLSANSVDILNAIRDNGTENYRNFVPYANPNTDSIKEIGQIIMQFPALQNEFLSALINRIGRVLITSKMYDNPWRAFKKGLLEFGEVIEEIFVNIAKPFQFDQALAETNIFKRNMPDVRSAFHVMNYQKFYKTFISNDQLRQAFLSWQGITDLIARIVDSMYTGANYDEFLTMKYLLARHILNGQMYPVTIPAATAESAKEIVTTVKGVSNLLQFGSTKYNLAGVFTFTNRDDQFILINAKFDAVMDVNVLASAFNMDKAEFLGHRVLVDSFGSLDIPRLNELLGDNPGYTAPTADELAALDAIPAIIVDRDWFMIFDNFYNFTEQYNGEGLYWNYWYHTWKTFSVSPFAQNALFVPGTPTITSVSVNPATATVSKGQTATFNAVVASTNFAPRSVTWEIDSTISSISNTGVLTVASTETAQTITVKAVSTFDPTKSGSAVITVSGATP